MDLTLIIYFVILIVLIVLIFKFIKKIIWAIITTVLVIVLSILCIAGLVYLDYNELSQIDNATISLAYVDDDEFITGFSLPINNNSEIDINNVKTISKEDYENSLDKKEKDKFVVSFQKGVLDIFENESISLNELLEDQGFSDFVTDEIAISAKDVLKVLDSNNAAEEFADVLLAEMELGETLEEIAKPLVIEAIKEIETQQGVDIKSIAFGLLLSQAGENELKLLDLFIEYQNGNIEIYPNKLSFRLAKYVPISFIQDAILGEDSESSRGIEN